MGDLQAIREGLAANLAALRTNETVVQVSAYLLDNPTPPSLVVAGVDSDGYEEQAYTGQSVSYTILVEACLGLVADITSQKTLNRLLSPTGSASLVAAAKATPTLTSRLNDDGTISTGQAAAAESIAFDGYRGQTRFVLSNGSEVLLATWAFTVFA